MITDCTLTCPHCHFSETIEMPEYACQQFHTCSHCKTRLQTKQGNCCIYCSYGDTPCPPAQIAGSACCSTDWSS